MLMFSNQKSLHVLLRSRFHSFCEREEIWWKSIGESVVIYFDPVALILACSAMTEVIK